MCIRDSFYGKTDVQDPWIPLLSVRLKNSVISSYRERGAHGWEKTAQRTELLNERRQTKETIRQCKQEDSSSSRREKSANSDSSDAPDAWGRFQKKAEEKIYKQLRQDWGNYGRQWYGKTGWDSSSSGSSSTRPSTHSEWYHRRAHYPDSAENDRSSKKPRTSGGSSSRSGTPARWRPKEEQPAHREL